MSIADEAERKPAASADPTGVANTDVVMFTATTASKVNAMPAGWAGKFIRIQPIGTDIYYFFAVTNNLNGAPVAPSNTIALPPAATDAGAFAATQGELIKSGVVLALQCPNASVNQTAWFCRWGVTAAQSVQITKASGKPGWNTAE